MGAAASEDRFADDDDDAIARVLAGETAAFRILVERHEGPIVRFARGLAPRSSAPEDIAQEAFVSAFMALATFDRRRGRFRSWLLTITKNLCLNARQKKTPLPLAEPPETVAPFTPADELVAAHARRSLDAALGALPDPLRSCFVLAEIVGVPMGEVADMDRVPIGTIRSRLSRAKARLRAALAPIRGGQS
jgi:RNA polymerase sigma-70 factor (ECF subfamily)